MATQIALKNLNFANAASLPLSTTITAPDGSNPIAYGLINQMAKSKIEMETRAIDFSTTSDAEKAQFIVPKNTIPAETNMSIFFAQSYPYGNRSVFDSYINVNAYIHNLISFANTYDFFSIKTGTAPTNLFYRIRQEVDPRTAYTGATHVFAKINISDDPSNRFIKTIDTTEAVEESYISELIDNNYICLYNGMEGKFLQAFMAYSGAAGSRTLMRESERYFYNNPFIVLTSEKLAVAEVVNGAYTGNITEIEGDVKNCLHLFTPFMTSSTYYDTFSENPFGKLFKEDDIIKIICKTRINETGYRGYFTFVKRDALVRYMNYLGIPFVIDDDFNVISPDLQKPVDELPDYDQSIEYVDPEGPPTGQSNNTSSDWTGAGDNNEDSFTQTVPHFSPYGSVVNQYAMSGLQVQQFIRELFQGSWITNPDLFNNDPKEGLVSCRYYPFNVRFHDSSGIGNDENIVVGAVEMEYSSGARILPNYNQILDLGEFKVDEYFGGFLDYQLTTVDVYLPYVGWQQIPANALMGRTLKIKYVVDIISGDCSCLLTTTDGKVERFENIFSGHMGIDIPILTSNHNENTKQAASSVLSAITAVGGAVATYATGGIGGLAAAGISAAAITNSATDIATMQNHANMGTPISSSSALWMPQDIIFRITRPRKSEATEFKNRWGYRANFSTKLSATSGFTQVDNPKLDFACDESERVEIKQLLQGGIYL